MVRRSRSSFQSRLWESVVFAIAAWVPNLFFGAALRRLLYRGVMGSVGSGVQIDPHVEVLGAGCVTLGERVALERGVRIDGRGDGNRLVLGRWARLGMGVDIRAMDGTTIEIGDGTYIGPHTCLSGPGAIRIGRDCLISAHVGACANSHVFADPERPIRKQGLVCQGIVIEDDCWIGHGVTIIDGVTIGRGSVIGAGAVVTRDIPSESVAVGVPARVISNRRERSARAEHEAQSGQRAAQVQPTAPRQPRAHDEQAATSDSPSMLHGVLECIRSALAVDTVTVLLAASDGRHLCVHDSVGLEEEVEEGVCIPVGVGIAGRIAASGTPLLVEDLSTTEVASPILRNRGLRQLLGTPLRVEDQIVGVLHVGTAEAQRFGEEDRRRLQELAESLRPFVQFSAA